MTPDNEPKVIFLKDAGQVPKAVVFVDKNQRPMTPAEAKRARYVKNLKNNYARLNEALAFFEYFAGICELSLPCRESIRKANTEAIEELAKKLHDKLAAYDKRLKEGA